MKLLITILLYSSLIGCVRLAGVSGEIKYHSGKKVEFKNLCISITSGTTIRLINCKTNKLKYKIDFNDNVDTLTIHK